MAQERLAPTATLSSAGLFNTGPERLDDDPDSPDGLWAQANPANNNTTSIRCAMADPAQTPTVGAGLQEFRVLVRKTNLPTNPSVVIELWESGSLVRAGGSVTVTSTTGQVVSFTWNANELATASGVNVECRAVGSPGGGNPSDRAVVEYGAIEWNAETSAGARTGILAATEGGDAASSQGDVIVRGALAGVDTVDSTTWGGEVLIRGAVSATDAADFIAASGGSVSTGSMSAVDQADGITAAGKIIIQGAFASLDPQDVVSAQGGVSTKGTFSTTDAIDAAFASGAVLIAGSVLAVENVDSIFASGSQVALGQMNATDLADATGITGRVAVEGAFSPFEQADAMGFGGAVPISASFAMAEIIDSLVASGSALSDTVSGVFSASEAPDILAANYGGAAVLGVNEATVFFMLMSERSRKRDDDRQRSVRREIR